MSDGDRSGDDSSLGLAAGFLVAVALFCLWIGYLDAQTDQYRHQSEEAKKLAVDFCADRVDEPDCVTDTLKAFQEQNYGQKDVRAQEHMAIYALGMFIATAIGVAFVARTLHATRQAVGIASKTLKETVRLGNEQVAEARNATAETRRVGEKQTQAYLTSNKGYFWLREYFHKGSKNVERAISLKVAIANNGQSPGHAIEIVYSGTLFCELPDFNGCWEGYFQTSGTTFCADVGPHDVEQAIIEFPLFADFELGKFEQSHSYVEVSGTIYWTNEFGNGQHQAFTLHSAPCWGSYFFNDKGWFDPVITRDLEGAGKRRH